MKNRKRLFFVLSVLLVSLVLAACAGPAPEVVREVEKEAPAPVEEAAPAEEAEEAAEPVEAVEGGTLTYAINQEGATLDPGTGRFAVETMIMFQLYDNLIWLDENVELQPGLAKSWSQSEDSTVFDLELRDDVMFHDGEPFNADAVISWMDHIMAPDYPIGAAVRWVGQIESVEKTGDYSVRITLNEPSLLYLQTVASLPTGIGSPKAVAELGDEFGAKPVGTGPFMFDEWLPGSHVKLVKNPDYNWASPMFNHSGPAYLDEVVFQFIPEDATRIAALESGDVSVVARVPQVDAGRLAETEGLNVISNFIPGVPQHNAINVSVSPTDDLKVRQAINFAVDKQGIVDTVYFGLTTPAYGPVTQLDQAAYNPEVESLYPYDPEKAMALLEEAGWVDGDGDGIRERDGETLQAVIVQNQGWNEWVEFLQANLIAVGFDATIDTLAGAATNERGDSCVSQLPSNGGVSVDALDLQSFFGTEASSNWACLDDPVLDDLIAQAKTTLDIDERNELIKQIQMQIMENAYEIPLVELAFYTGMQEGVSGIAFDATSFYPWLYDASIQP